MMTSDMSHIPPVNVLLKHHFYLLDRVSYLERKYRKAIRLLMDNGIAVNFDSCAPFEATQTLQEEKYVQKENTIHETTNQQSNRKRKKKRNNKKKEAGIQTKNECKKNVIVNNLNGKNLNNIKKWDEDNCLQQHTSPNPFEALSSNNTVTCSECSQTNSYDSISEVFLS